MHTHNLALLAVLWLPAALAGTARAVRGGARRGWPGAARLVRGWHGLDRLSRAALVLMAVAAAVHVALIPGHSGEPLTQALFALDTLGLAAAALAALAGAPLWRAGAVALLLGAIGAYAVYLATGQETADFTGLLTKGVELAAAGLLVQARAWPRLVSAFA